MMLAMDQVPCHALNGMLLPLDDLASQEYKDALYPVVKDALTVNGTMYAAARDVTPKVMYLNTKMFEDAGIEIPADTGRWTSSSRSPSSSPRAAARMPSGVITGQTRPTKPSP